MILIHSIDTVKIKKIKEKEFSITYDPFFSFFFSLYKIKYKRENDIIHFECDSFQSLKEFINNSTTKRLNYDKTIKMIYDIGFIIKNTVFLLKNPSLFSMMNLQCNFMMRGIQDWSIVF